MSVINRLPKALQEFLGNTQAGVNPSELTQVVSPGFDMTPHWSVDQMQWQSVVGVVTTVGNAATITVPQGEVWRPLHLTGYMAGLDEGDDIRLEIGLFSQNFTRFPLKMGDSYSQPAIGIGVDRYSLGHSWSMVELYPPGWKFYAAANAINFTAPSENITCSLIYIRMKA